jgi:hypothetical protein
MAAVPIVVVIAYISGGGSGGIPSAQQIADFTAGGSYRLFFRFFFLRLRVVFFLKRFGTAAGEYKNQQPENTHG